MNKYDLEDSLIFAEKERDFELTQSLRRYTPEQTVHAKYCSQMDECHDDHCRCVDVVKGAQVSFVGNVGQLKSLIA